MTEQIGKTAKMARADWLEAGAALLAGGGSAALTIDRLCVLTGRTKGAFYHHFGSISGFEDALLGHWAEANANRVAAAAASADAPVTPEDLAVGLNTGLEGEVRRWAAVSIAARRAVAAVDAGRVDFLTQRRRTAHPDLPPDQAHDLALLQYATFLGLLDLLPAADTDAITRLGALLQEKLAS